VSEREGRAQRAQTVPVYHLSQQLTEMTCVHEFSFHGLFGHRNTPFHKSSVTPHTCVSMAVCGCEVNFELHIRCRIGPISGHQVCFARFLKFSRLI